MQRLLKQKITQKQILTMACALLCCGFGSFAYATTDSTAISAPSAMAAPTTRVIGVGSAYLRPYVTTTVGNTWPLEGICQPPTQFQVNASVTGIDSGGGGCYDKFIDLQIWGIQGTIFGSRPLYSIVARGAVNTTSDCSVGQYLGFTITWVASCVCQGSAVCGQ